MKPTEQEINNEANLCQVDEYDCGNTGDLARAFKEGAEWAISQMQPEWVACADRLPENNTHHAVLINGDRNTSHQMFYTGGYDAIFKEWLNPFGDKIEENVTHWMPLPQPPTK